MKSTFSILLKLIFLAVVFFFSFKIATAQTLDTTKINVRQNINYQFRGLRIDTALMIGTQNVNATDILHFKTAYGWGNHAAAGYAPSSRTITINGITYDLTQNRSWTVSGGNSGYTWVDYFDDDPSLSSNQVTGLNNTFTLSQTPLDSVRVFKNGILQKNKTDYTITGNTLTFINNSFSLPNNTTVTRTGGQYFVTVNGIMENYNVGDYVTVSGASPSSLNGTFYITQKISDFAFSYISQDTTAVASNTPTSIVLNKYVKKKDVVMVIYNYSSAQPNFTRLNNSNIYNYIDYSNSIGYGSPTQNNLSDRNTQLSKMLPVTIKVTNLSTPSISTTGLNNNISTVLTPKINTAYKKNIVFVSEGTNDINLNLANSYVAEQNIKTLCLNIKAITGSPKVIVSTIIPFNNPSKDSIRTAVNAWILANWNTFADSVVDIASNPNFNSLNSIYNRAIYYTDGVHLTPEGHNQYAQEIYNVLMPFLRYSTITTDKTQATLLPTDNTIHNGGDFYLSNTAQVVIGTKSPFPFNMMANNSIGATLDTTNTFILSGTVQSSLNRVFGFDLSKGFSPITSGKRFAAAHIKPSFGSISDSTSFLLIESQYGYNDVLDLKATADVDNNYKGYFYGRWYSNSLNIPIDVTFTSLTGGYMGGITFGGFASGSPNNMFIGRNSNNLYYNVASGQNHYLQVSNSSVLGINSASINAYQSIIANTNAGVNIGSTTNKFFNGYFANKVVTPVIAGDTAANGSIKITGTTSGSPGTVYLGSSGYIKITESNSYFGLGNYSFTPLYPFHISLNGIGTLYYESKTDAIRILMASASGYDALLNFYNGNNSRWLLRNQGSVADAFQLYNQNLAKPAFQVGLLTNRALFGYTSEQDTSKIQTDGYVLAKGYKIPSGTSSQFLKADGSTDNSTYATQTYVQNYITGGKEQVAYLTTTDASATTILSYTPYSGESGSIETYVVGVKNDGTAGGSFYSQIQYFYNGSTLYTISSRNPWADQFNASGINIAYSQSGSNVLVRPNGRAGETWYWTIYYKIRNTTGNGTSHTF